MGLLGGLNTHVCRLTPKHMTIYKGSCNTTTTTKSITWWVGRDNRFISGLTGINASETGVESWIPIHPLISPYQTSMNTAMTANHWTSFVQTTIFFVPKLRTNPVHLPESTDLATWPQKVSFCSSSAESVLFEAGHAELRVQKGWRGKYVVY